MHWATISTCMCISGWYGGEVLHTKCWHQSESIPGFLDVKYGISCISHLQARAFLKSNVTFVYFGFVSGCTRAFLATAQYRGTMEVVIPTVSKAGIELKPRMFH